MMPVKVLPPSSMMRKKRPREFSLSTNSKYLRSTFNGSDFNVISFTRGRGWGCCRDRIGGYGLKGEECSFEIILVSRLSGFAAGRVGVAQHRRNRREDCFPRTYFVPAG